MQGFDRRKAPLVILFTGPSGVGKTELAHHIAAMVHGTTPHAMRAARGGGDCFVQIPMNQYHFARRSVHVVLRSRKCTQRHPLHTF